MDRRVWVVTGCSSGIGRATVETVLNATKDLVVATVRQAGTLVDLSEKNHDRLHEFVLEVTDSAGRESLNAYVFETFGRIDVLVNNAGIATMGSALDLPEVELKRVFETNFFAAVALSQWAGRLMVAQKSGVIIQISSTAGLMGFAANGAYGASKFALEGFSEVLQEELQGFGVRVHLIEPGNCNTNFFGHNYRSVESASTIDSVNQALEFFESRSTGKPSIGLTADQVAEAVLAAANGSNAPFRLMVGNEALMTGRGKLDLLNEDFRRSLAFPSEPKA